MRILFFLFSLKNTLSSIVIESGSLKTAIIDNRVSSEEFNYIEGVGVVVIIQVYGEEDIFELVYVLVINEFPLYSK